LLRKYILAFGLFACFAHEAAAQWHRVESEECGLSVSYPGTVSKQSRTNRLSDSLTTREYRYLSASEGHYFLTYCSVWPDGFIKGDADEMLQRGVAGVDGEVLQTQEITLDEYPGRSFVVDLASGAGQTFVRAYIAGNVVVQIRAIQRGSANSDLSPASRRFLVSIRINR
jgi:hypothetical protein